MARLLGRWAAEVVAFFRDKPWIPCQITWYEPDPLLKYVDEHRVRIAEEQCCASCENGCWSGGEA